METEEVKYLKMLKEVSSLIATNNHTEARIVIAKFFGCRKYFEQLQDVEMANNRTGYITEELLKERSNITKRLFNRISFLFGEPIAKEVYSKL